MKIAIIYFSGTGNTKAVAELYTKSFVDLGHQVQCTSIEENPKLNNPDLLIIGGPIYAGNMPDELIYWVRKNIPNTVDGKAIVYSTSAGLKNANGTKSIGKKLIKKGYQVIDELTIQMPRNFYIDKYEPTPIEDQQTQFEDMINIVIDSVENLNLNKVIRIEESTVSIDFWADIFRLMAKQLGKKFAINDGCINCGTCEKNCPKQNIDVSKGKYSNKCILCTRCIHNCPVNAISYKGKTIEQYKGVEINNK